jgi:hypothetical protein
LLLGLAAGAALAPAPALARSSGETADATAAELDQVVCKRGIVTGSRAKTSRTCKTRREWVNAQNHLRNEWSEAIKLGNQVPPKD